MGLYSYSNEKNKYPMCPEYKKEESYSYLGGGEYQKDDGGSRGYECKKDDCDSESARALKKILSLLDDLNDQDLRILEEIIERLLCSRKKVY